MLAKQILIEELMTLRSKDGVRFLGYVIMPEHIHLVLWPPLDTQLGVLIGQVKGRAGHRIVRIADETVLRGLAVTTREQRQYQVFQRRCYDHNCRTIDAVRDKVEYRHKNPVTRGLVNSPGEWAWSSYNWYQGARDVPFGMDAIAW